MSYILIKIPRHPAFSSSWSLSQSISFPHSQLHVFTLLSLIRAHCVRMRVGPSIATRAPTSRHAPTDSLVFFPQQPSIGNSSSARVGGGSHAPLLSAVERYADCLQLSGSMQINTAAVRLQPQRPSYAQKILSRPFLLFAQKTIYKRVTIF